MTKKHFIALADHIRYHNSTCLANPKWRDQFSITQIAALATFCEQQNPRFNHERWLAYIKGECGKNGGKVKS